MQAAARPEPDLAALYPDVNLPKERAVYLLHSPFTTQAFVRALFVRSPIVTRDAVLADLYEQYMGGSFSGAIERTLRASRGLAGHASTELDTPRRIDAPRYLTVEYLVAPERVVEASRAVFDTVIGSTDPELLKQAKFALEATYRARRFAPHEVPSPIVSQLAQGFDGDPLLDKWTQLPSVDLPRFAAFAAAFAQHPPIIAIVANRDRIDMQSLRTLGRIEEVTAKDITSLAR